jgi:PAS domain S-box-containing protein
MIETFLSIINNTALLILLVLAYDLLYPRLSRKSTVTRSLLTGFALGLIGMVVMLVPWQCTSGVTFDTRSILLSLSGLFFGPVPTAAAAAMTIVLRIVQGGAGTLTGSLVIIASAGIGLLWRYISLFRKKPSSHMPSSKKPSQFLSLYLLGWIVHVVMLLLMFTLPRGLTLPLLKQLTLPLLLVYPLGTALLGTLLNKRIEERQFSISLAESRELLQQEIIGKEKAEKKFREYVEHSPVGIFVTDDNGDYQDVNKAAEQVSGYSRNELLQMNIRDFSVTADAAAEQQTFQAGIVSGEVSKTLPFRRKDGTTGYWTINAVKLANNRFLGFTNDITSLVEAEQKITAEKERLLVTLRSIGDGVITTDTEGRVQLMNTVAERLTGWSQSEAEGMPLFEVFHIVHEQTGTMCENPVEKVLASGTIVELANHTLLISRSGDRFVIADSGAPIRNQDPGDRGSRIIGVVLVFRDMTDEYRIQESMQKTVRLDSLGVLAGGIAHDFNNLLSGLFGYIELARDSSLRGEDNTDYLDEILPIFNRAKNLTHQLLTFSKGGNPIREPKDLKRLIMDSTSFALSGSNIKAGYHITSDLWHCSIDEQQIGQVIDNIVINAQQAMPSGGQLTVTAENIVVEKHALPLLPAGDYAHIAISDTGIGIPSSILDNIFDPFFTTKQKGNGLGLATCYSIISKHDGTITVDSTPGEGSTFHLYLPRSRQAPDMESTSPGSTHTGTGRILIMDDEKIVREVVGKMLETMGYAIDAFADGQEILDVCQELHERRSRGETADNPYAAAFLDLTIPGGLGGKDIIAELREYCPDIPIFATSGYSEDEVMARPQKYGFTDGIPKAFRSKELGDLLAKHHVGN